MLARFLKPTLGWAAKGIGFKIAEMADDKANPKKLRSYLGDVYSACPGFEKHDLKGFSDNEIDTLADNLRLRCSNGDTSF